HAGTTDASTAAFVPAGPGKNHGALDADRAAAGAADTGFRANVASGRELRRNFVSNAADRYTGIEPDRRHRCGPDTGLAFSGGALVTADYSAAHSRADFRYRNGGGSGRRLSGSRLSGTNGRFSVSGADIGAVCRRSSVKNQPVQQLTVFQQGNNEQLTARR